MTKRLHEKQISELSEELSRVKGEKYDREKYLAKVISSS